MGTCPYQGRCSFYYARSGLISSRITVLRHGAQSNLLCRTICATIRLMSAQKRPWSCWTIARYGMLGFMLLVSALMLKRPSLLAEAAPGAAVRQDSESFQAKWVDLEQAHLRGETSEFRFTADEVNAAFQESLSGTSEVSSQNSADVKPAQFFFAGDHVTGQFVANVHGRYVYLTVSGKLRVVEGYLTFDLMDMKIGDLPVPVSLVRMQLQSKLREPETREKMKLPAYVADLRIENGQLVVLEK